MKYSLVDNKKKALVEVDIDINELAFTFTPAIHSQFCEDLKEPIMNFRLKTMKEYVELCASNDITGLTNLQNKIENRVNVLLLEELQKNTKIGIPMYITVGM